MTNIHSIENIYSLFFEEKLCFVEKYPSNHHP